MAATGLTFDYSSLPPEIMENARRRGITIHAAIDAHQKGHRFRVPLQWVPFWRAYERFMDESQHQPIASEVTVVHPAWNYTGHIDRVGWVGLQRSLLDWKCTKHLDEGAVAIQLGAYRMAYNAMYPAEPIHACAAVQLLPDGSYRLVWVDTEESESVFLAALVVYRARIRLGRIPWPGQ